MSVRTNNSPHTPDTVSFTINFYCELSKTTSQKQLNFSHFPKTVKDFKKKIEDDCSIPACIQTLTFQSVALADNDSLDEIHCRSGDTFYVSYLEEGDCETVQLVSDWLNELIVAYQMNVSDQRDYSGRFDNVVEIGYTNGFPQALSLDLFYPWKEKKTLINKLYFENIGGLELLMSLYAFMVNSEWKTHTLCGKYMECICAQSVANFTQTFPLRRSVVKHHGIDLCLKTLLRKEVTEDSAAFDEDETHKTLLQSAVEIALYAVCNLSELPECQYPLASRTDAVDQAVNIAKSDIFTCKTSIVSASLLLCLAQCPEAHVHLLRTEAIEGLLDACEKRETKAKEGGERLIAAMALKSYTCIVMAQMALSSPTLVRTSLPLPLLQRVLSMMQYVLTFSTPQEICHYEEDEGLVWGTFLPYFRCLYAPIEQLSNDIDHVHRKTIRDLNVCSCKILLHALENALGRELHRTILHEENLLGYLGCLPNIVDTESKSKAESLVSEMSKYTQLQPPSLCTLVKAKLAKSDYGLQAVMDMTSIAELVCKKSVFF